MSLADSGRLLETHYDSIDWQTDSDCLTVWICWLLTVDSWPTDWLTACFCLASCLIRLFDDCWNLKHVLMRLDRKKEIDVTIGNGEHPADAADTDAATGFIWDLTNSVTFSCWKSNCHREHLPCLLRGHRLWHTSKQRNLDWNWVDHQLVSRSLWGWVG